MITHEPNPLYVANPERYKTMKFLRKKWVALAALIAGFMAKLRRG
ncbi:MAG: hypothetical protein K0Q78_1461 [Cellvibrio sp.]|nr:hypothetical protein [Cellvibrio sp.]